MTNQSNQSINQLFLEMPVKFDIEKKIFIYIKKQEIKTKNNKHFD